MSKRGFSKLKPIFLTESDSQNHESYDLLEDRKFLYNLMVCGKKSDNKPTEDFVLASPAPVDVAAKISAYYREDG